MSNFGKYILVNFNTIELNDFTHNDTKIPNN